MCGITTTKDKNAYRCIYIYTIYFFSHRRCRSSFWKKSGLQFAGVSGTNTWQQYLVTLCSQPIIHYNDHSFLSVVATVFKDRRSRYFCLMCSRVWRISVERMLKIINFCAFSLFFLQFATFYIKMEFYYYYISLWIMHFVKGWIFEIINTMSKRRLYNNGLYIARFLSQIFKANMLKILLKIRILFLNYINFALKYQRYC